MAGTMTMNRVIHSAVRRDLRRLATALGSVRDGDTDRAGSLLRAYANLLGQLKHHHEQEDRHVFPALGRLGVDTTLIREMDDEHQAMARALDATTVLMHAYGRTASAADAVAARAGVKETTAVVERHLAHEENELEPLMQPHLETPEWKQAEKALRKMPPTEAGVFFAWITDGMEVEGRTYLRSTIPRPVVGGFSKVLGRRYHREVAPVWKATHL